MDPAARGHHPGIDARTAHPGPSLSYRRRLRIEGLTLAACGAAGSVALLAAVDASRDGPANTIAQLAVVAIGLAGLGPFVVRRWAERAPVVAPGGTGEPTPLWQLPLICFGLALAFGLPAGAWDAALRVTAGCVLAGLAQGVLFERVAARAEARRGGTLVRIAGSRGLGGTRLGLIED